MPQKPTQMGIHCRKMTEFCTPSRSIQSLSSSCALSLLLVLVSPAIPSAGAQPVPNSPTDQYQYARFSPSMAIIVVVLVTALFFMGFFSIYIRRCAGDGSTGGSLRQALSMRRGRTGPASRGLEREVIDTFPIFVYSTVKGLKIGKGALECAVCLNEFEDEETLRLIPKCDHAFHPECIGAWLESHVTCPVCRANLVPQPGEPPRTADSIPGDDDAAATVEIVGGQQNGDVSIRMPDSDATEHPMPEVVDRNPSLRNRPPRSRSMRPKFFEKFRSHSTGHSLILPGENTDRYTLRLPEEVRKQAMIRAKLNRTASTLVLPREESTRRGYRTGEGSSRGRSYKRFGSLDRSVFTRAPSFLTRAFSSVTSPKVVADDGAKSASTAAKDGGESDETGLIGADSARLPV